MSINEGKLDGFVNGITGLMELYELDMNEIFTGLALVTASCLVEGCEGVDGEPDMEMLDDMVMAYSELLEQFVEEGLVTNN